MKFNRGSSPRIEVFLKDNINGQSRNRGLLHRRQYASVICSGIASKVLGRGCTRKYFDFYPIEHIHTRQEINCATNVLAIFFTSFISDALLI